MLGREWCAIAIRTAFEVSKPYRYARKAAGVINVETFKVSFKTL